VHIIDVSLHILEISASLPTHPKVLTSCECLLSGKQGTAMTAIEKKNYESVCVLNLEKLGLTEGCKRGIREVHERPLTGDTLDCR
jgi:hypothetical protein